MWCRNDTPKSQNGVKKAHQKTKNGVGMIHHEKFPTKRDVEMIHQKRRLV